MFSTLEIRHSGGSTGNWQGGAFLTVCRLIDTCCNTWRHGSMLQMIVAPLENEHVRITGVSLVCKVHYVRGGC